MSLALRLRESRWFRSALEQPYTQPENRLNGAGNGDLGLQGTKYVRTYGEGSVVVPNTEMCESRSRSKLQNGQCIVRNILSNCFSNIEILSNLCPNE